MLGTKIPGTKQSTPRLTIKFEGQRNTFHAWHCKFRD